MTPFVPLSFCFRLILRFMALLLGIGVSQKGFEERNRSARVIVANHVSVLDHVALDFITPVVTVSILFSNYQSTILRDRTESVPPFTVSKLLNHTGHNHHDSGLLYALRLIIHIMV